MIVLTHIHWHWNHTLSRCRSNNAFSKCIIFPWIVVVTTILFWRLKVQQVFKGWNYSRETIFFCDLGSVHSLNYCHKLVLDICYEAHFDSCNTVKKIMYISSIYLTSVSKKSEQTIVLHHYCGLSRFFWNRR